MDNPQKQALLAQLTSLNALKLASRGLVQAPTFHVHVPRPMSTFAARLVPARSRA